MKKHPALSILYLAITAALASLVTSCMITIEPAVCSLNNNTCNPDQYCMFALGICGENNALGTCQLKPDVCIEIFMPVCGCDSQTYTNDCMAASAGVNIQTIGVCDNN